MEYVAEVAGFLGLRDDTVHYAMAYADRLRERVQAEGSQMLLAAVACLVVAAKFVEKGLDDDGFCMTPSYSGVVQALGSPPGWLLLAVACFSLINCCIPRSLAQCKLCGISHKALFCRRRLGVAAGRL